MITERRIITLARTAVYLINRKGLRVLGGKVMEEVLDRMNEFYVAANSQGGAMKLQAMMADVMDRFDVGNDPMYVLQNPEQFANHHGA